MVWRVFGEGDVGELFVHLTSLVPQLHAAAEAWDSVDADHDRKCDEQHGYAEDRDRAEVARLLEIENEARRSPWSPT